MMPHLDGRGVLRRLHQSDELTAIPFILYSAASKSSVQWLKSEFGLDVDSHFLSAPFDAQDLLDMIADLANVMYT